jgi:hypothetical protein
MRGATRGQQKKRSLTSQAQHSKTPVFINFTTSTLRDALVCVLRN